MSVGYAYVHDTLKLAVLPPRRAARVRPVTRIERTVDHIAVPASVAPAVGDPLQHLLFGLKHEGVELAILMEAFAKIPAERVLEEMRRTPSGAYARMAGLTRVSLSVAIIGLTEYPVSG